VWHKTVGTGFSPCITEPPQIRLQPLGYAFRVSRDFSAPSSASEEICSAKAYFSKPSSAAEEMQGGSHAFQGRRPVPYQHGAQPHGSSTPRNEGCKPDLYDQPHLYNGTRSCFWWCGGAEDAGNSAPGTRYPLYPLTRNHQWFIKPIAYGVSRRDYLVVRQLKFVT